MLEDDNKSNNRKKETAKLSPPPPTSLKMMNTRILAPTLLFVIVIPFISQDLNLNRPLFSPLVSATITHQHFNNGNNNNNTLIANNLNNNNQTTNPEEFLLNLVKNNYKTGANPNSNQNATSSTSTASTSSSQSSPSASSAASSASSAPLQPQNRPPQPPSRSNQPPLHYQTTYACEGNQLEFGCQEGKMIHLVRAIYGRFSLSICNEQGYSNYSVDCASFKAFLLMETRCNKLNNCSVNVSEELFGDPCQGTSKYLEVQYYCYDAANNHHNNNQSQQVPIHHRTNQLAVPNHLSNFGTQQPATLNSNNPPQFAGATPLLSNDIAHKSPQPQLPLQVGTSIFGQQQPKFIQQNSVGGSGSGRQMTTTNDEQSFSQADSADQSDTVIIGQPNGNQHYCLPQTSARNLHWNYTRAGQLAKQSCPDGSLGEVSWLCDADRLRFLPQWSPDFTGCKLQWLVGLSRQLERMLESPGKQQQSAPEMTRQQNEQILKQVLSDLTLMARTKELFSEDLERIDIMISQILAQFRSLSVVFGSLDSWRSPILLGGARNNNFAFLYEDLFRKLTSLVSSLFDANQRSAWLEIRQAADRHRLEQRFLAHLKEAGILMANVFGSSLANNQLEPIRQPNVFAGFAVINNNGNLEFPSSSSSSAGNSLMASSEDNDELKVQLRQATTQSISNLNNNRFASNSQADEEDQQQQQILNEFRVHSSVLRELTTKGITRLLVIDVRKPNYSLMKQQLESAYATILASQDSVDPVDPTGWLSVLDGGQLWTTRVFGVFAIVGDNGEVLDGQQSPQQHRAVDDLLAQRPISVDFRSLLQVTPQVSTAYQPQVARTCSSLDLTSSGNAGSVNGAYQPELVDQPCKTYKVNATSHICRCNRFGFVALISHATQQPTNLVSTGRDINSVLQQWPATNQLGGVGADLLDQASYIGAQGKLGQQQQSVGTWTAVFIALGLFLLVLFVGAFLINAFIRVSSHSRLSKQPGGFLAAAGFGSHHHHHRDLSSGPTTGPLMDHSLVGGDPLVAAAVSGNSGTTQSGSIIGLTQSAYQGYKQHQQSALYAAHLGVPSVGMCPRNRWLRLTQLLNPARWLSSQRFKDDQMIQHRVIGSSLSGGSGSTKVPGSVSYKSTTYQNGYTTAGLHGHPALVHTGAAQMPLGAAPSSSTSSYVSSSAYYEEIGPGNLTKVNTNQINGNQNPQRLATSQTLIDPFKRSPQIDQSPQHQVMGQQQATLWIQQPNTTNAYPMDQSNYGGHQQQHQVSMMPTSGFSKNHNDLNQLQQHQQSTGSGGSTPRHYLFASPTAVTAYKSSMSQQHQQATTLNHHHHCQQMQFKTSQEQQQHRFMPN